MFNPSKELQQEIEHVIDFYSKIDEEGFLSIDLSKVPDFVIDTLCSKIMLTDRERAYEATGADNDNFLTDMLPSLITMMEKGDNCSSQEFVSTWKKCVRNYLSNTIDALLEDAISVKNNNFPLYKNVYQLAHTYL